MKKKVMTSNNVSVIHFENNKIPVFKEEKNKEWINCGEKNDYPLYLINLFNRSAKHNAIVTGKVHYIKGNGLEIDDSQMNTAQKAKFLNWLNNLSSSGTTDQLLTKVITDEELFDGVYLECIPNKLGTAIAQANQIGFEKLRVSKEENGYWYSKDWSKYRQSADETGLRFIPCYDPLTKSGIYRYKGYRPGLGVYPLPEYIGCIPYIEIDYEISNYHLNNIKNGFVGGTMLSFNNGTPSTEEQKTIEGKVKSKFTGTDKAGQLVITFSENKDSAPTIIPLLPNDFDKMFIQLNETVMQEIFTGHKITSLSLFGIKESKGLGGKDELRNAYELFQNGYVNAKQNIIASIFNDLAEASGYGRPLSITPIEPINEGLSQVDIVKVMTNDEIRSKAGLPALSSDVKDESRKVLDSINSLSPAVANKVLETMSVDEIRALASLGSKQASAMSQKFHKIENFKGIGRAREEFKILKSTEVFSKEDVVLQELSFYKEKFLDVEVLQSKILDLVLGNPSIKAEQIAKATGETLEVVKKEISNLIDRKLLSGNIGKLEVLPEGKTVIEQQPAEPQKLEIRYSYELRKNLPDLITESRDFCKYLMELDKLYTREEIEEISRLEGRDVWATRGGYYHNPELDQTTDYCRHVWLQNVVRRK